MLIHAALIQSDFFFSPSKSKIFPIIFFVWFVFNRKWENSIDNKKRSMHNCYIRINNCVCCFEAEHSKMHQTWMIPIETFRFRLQRLFLSEWVPFGSSTKYRHIQTYIFREMCWCISIPYFEQVISSLPQIGIAFISLFLPENPENRFNVHTHTSNRTTNIYDEVGA